MHFMRKSNSFIFNIIKLPMLICKYFYIGLKTVFISDCLFIYAIFKCIFNGIKKFINVITKPKKKEKVKKTKTKKETKKENYKVVVPFNVNEFNKLRNFKNKKINAIKEKIEENKKLEQTEKVNGKSKKKKKKEEAYVNEKLKSPSRFNMQLNDFVRGFSGFGSKIINKFKNNEFVKHNRNQEMMKREALLINFDGKDAEKSEKKVLYEYIAKNKDGKVVKDYFEAYSKVEVHSFLLSEGYEVYSIKTNKWIQLFHKNNNENKVKFKTRDLIFFITQLSTYIKAGIPLVEGLKILEKQYKNKKYKRILQSIIYDLTMGENFSNALLKQNVAFPRLLINMVKTAEMTGELPEVLDDQAEYYTQTEKIKKQMISAMIYPAIVFAASIGVAIFIMLYVVPKFVDIYESLDPSQIPDITLIVLAISNFLRDYAFVLLGGIVVFIAGFVALYKTNKTFKTICQLLVMKIPVIGNTIIYNEVSMFTKTFSSLLAHNVFITDSMEVLNKITNNEIYKMIILDTISNLAKGDKISEAFKDHWAFPIPAYEMLVTGEKTGQLPEMMQKVSAYYQELHADNVNKIRTISEPAITIFLTVIVGFLILAIIIPMFNMYQVVQTM